MTHWLLFFSIAKASKIGRWILDFQSGRLGRRKPTKGGRVRYYWWDQLPASTGAGFQPSTVVWDLFRLLRLLKRQGSLKILVGVQMTGPFWKGWFFRFHVSFRGSKSWFVEIVLCAQSWYACNILLYDFHVCHQRRWCNLLFGDVPFIISTKYNSLPTSQNRKWVYNMKNIIEMIGHSPQSHQVLYI